MQLSLQPHPDTPSAAVSRITVDVTRESGGLTLRYVASGRIGDLRLPRPSAPARSDELWRHTCFEAFLRQQAGDAYCEFNFAPSLHWAAYRFASYRSGMRSIEEMTALRIAIASDAATLELEAFLELDRLPDLSFDGAWRLGLSAVIEDVEGRISYWALAHPPGKPDFHHPDCFAVTLGGASPA